MAIDCDHPRPALDLPGYVPPRMPWQVPAFIPGLPSDAARVLRESLQGIYDELARQGRNRNLIPLVEDLFVRPGSVISGVGNGQTITLLPPGADGWTDPVTLLLTDLVSPVSVLYPDGTQTTLGAAGAYDFLPAGDDGYETSPSSLIMAGAVPTDTLLGRDSAGTGAVEFIALTAPLRFDGTGKVEIQANGIANTHIRQSAGLSVIGRAANTTGDVADITSGLPVDSQALYLRTNAAGTLIAWQTISEASLPRISDGQFFANMSGVSPGQVLAKNIGNMAGPGLTWNTANVGDYKFVVNGSTSIVIGTDAGTDDVQRAALTGDVTAAQNVNTTAFRNFTALSVLARAANSTGAPADVSTTSGSAAVLRESGGTLGFGTVALAGLANMAAGTVIGRTIDGGTGVPIALTGAEQGENVQFSTIVVDTTATGTVTAYSFPEPNNALVFQNLTVIVQGIVARPSGTPIWLRHTGTGSTTLVHQSGSAVSADTISTGGTDIVLTNTMQALLLYTNGRWRVYGVSHGTRPPFTGAIAAAANSFATLFAGIRDNGSAENDRTNLNFLSTTSVVSTITDDSGGDELEIAHERAALTGDVTAAQNVNTTAFRSFSALSVLGRSAATAGIPTEISAVAAGGGVLRESGSTIGFGTITLAAFPSIAAGSMLANVTAGVAVPTAHDLATLFGAGLTYTNVTGVGAVGAGAGGSLVVGANDVQRAALTGDVTAAQDSNATTIATAAVTLAKMADLAQSRIIGRAEGAGTGVPTALTPTQVVAIVDGENVAWTGVHSFTSTTFDVNVTNDMRLGAASGIGFYAATTPGAVATGHVVVNATAGFGVVVDPAAAAVSSGGAGFLTFSATSDMWMSTTAGGIALSTEAAHPTGVTNGLILLDSVGAVQLDPATSLVINTAGVQRLTIESDGSWNVGGSNGTTGLTLVSAGSTAPPTWAQLPTAGITDAAVTLAKMANLAQSTIIGRAEGAGTGVPVALTPTQVIAIVDGESPTWTSSHRFDSFIQFGTSTLLPASGDIRRTGPLSIEGGNNITLHAVQFVTLDADADVQLLADDDVRITAGDELAIIALTTTVDSTNGIQLGSATGMPASGDIRKGSGAALTLNSALDLQLVASDDIQLIATDAIELTGTRVIATANTFSISNAWGHGGIGASTLNGSTNNYVLGNESVWRVSCVADPEQVTGIVPVITSGQRLLIVNLSPANRVRILPLNGASSSANQFTFNATSIDIANSQCREFWYDSDVSKWRPVAPF